MGASWFAGHLLKNNKDFILTKVLRLLRSNTEQLLFLVSAFWSHDTEVLLHLFV